MKKSYYKENESGRSMIEMLGVLAIIGVLSVGGIAGYSKAMMRIRINKTVEQISHIAAGIQTLFSNQPTRYAGADNVLTLVKAQIVSADMVGESTGYSSDYIDKYNKFLAINRMNPGQVGDLCNQEFGEWAECWQLLYQQQGDPSSYLSNKFPAVPPIINPFDGGLSITAGDKMFSLALSDIPQAACIELVSIDWSVTSSGFMGLTVGGQSTTSAMSVDAAVAGCSAEFNTINFVFK